jgi:DNA-binding transcriptional MerR regulator
MDEERFTRKELARRVGVTEHLWHKWTKLGLMPSCSEGKNKTCKYDRRHERRARLIQEMHDPEKVTLDELRIQFARHPDQYPFQ